MSSLEMICKDPLNIIIYLITLIIISPELTIFVIILFPITGLLTSIFILGETPNTYAYFGGAIIISGVAMILINKRKKN